MIFFALIVVIACKPDEEIVRNIKENSPTLPFDLEAKALFDNQESQDGFSVMLNWQNTSENGKGFIVERSSIGNFLVLHRSDMWLMKI